MAWQKGQSGNPLGKPRDKPLRDQIRRVLAEDTEDENGNKVKKLHALARRMVKEALDGNIAAMKEVGDRIDGKAVQQLDVTVEEVTAEEATDAALNEIIAYHSRRGRNGTAKKANGSEEPDSVH